MAETAKEAPRTLVPYLKFGGNGAPYLEGAKCRKCGQVYLGDRMACSKCFARNDFETVHLPTSGKLYTYSVVYRSYPGIKVPFVSATVDLDGACSIKGTLTGIEPEPSCIEMGMPVELVFEELEHKNKDGVPFVSYFFRPAQAA